MTTTHVLPAGAFGKSTLESVMTTRPHTCCYYFVPAGAFGKSRVKVDNAQSARKKCVEIMIGRSRMKQSNVCTFGPTSTKKKHGQKNTRWEGFIVCIYRCALDPIPKISDTVRAGMLQIRWWHRNRQLFVKRLLASAHTTTMMAFELFALLISSHSSPQQSWQLPYSLFTDNYPVARAE